MRVIAGKARRTSLKCIEGMDTRPTTDRIKETLFNMINADLYDCVFLDLFSGSGAIAIEALSRGARCAVLVENSGKAVRCIRENLERTHLADQARLLQQDAVAALQTLEGEYSHFDIVFMDPPYRKELEMAVLRQLAVRSYVDSDTLIIIEASLDTTLGDLNNMGFELIKIKKYKTNQHFFVRKVQTENENGNLSGKL